MKFTVFAFAMLPGVAMAHGSAAVHAHPHGAEGLIAGLALIAVAAGVAWFKR